MERVIPPAAKADDALTKSQSHRRRLRNRSSRRWQASQLMSVCFDPNGDVPGRLIAFFAAPYLHAANALVLRPALLVRSSMFEAGVKGEGAIDADTSHLFV